MPTSPPIRVVTWNIEHGKRTDLAVEQFLSNPNLADPDLVLLQEMDDNGPAEIAEALGLSYRYFAGCTHSGTGRPFGNAVLARGSIEQCEVIPLPHLALVMGQRRVAVRASVTLGSAENPIALNAWSVHAEVSTLPHRRQVAQYATVANSVMSSDTDRRIVAGDFNTASRRSLQSLTDRMAHAGMSRANTSAGRTFTRFGRGFELDQIFTSGFEVIDVGVVSAHDASDHDPVWALLVPS